jgi:hypothetical protein
MFLRQAGKDPVHFFIEDSFWSHHRGAKFERTLQSILAFANQSKMPHLAAGFCFLLAIKMQEKGVFFQEALPIWFPALPKITQEVDHDSVRALNYRAEGQSADGSDMLCKLACHRGFKRVMTRVVGARGQFVDNESPILKNEQFNGDQANDL